MLPPRENFSPEGAGAIGLLVATLADPADVVIGHATEAAPFTRCRFVAADTPLLPGFSASGTYARGVAATLARLRPRRIEVHNKPLLAGRLARRFRGTPVALFLHNDPRSMPGARTPAERAALGRCVQVVAVSQFVASLWGGECAVLPNAIAAADLPDLRASGQRRPVFLFAGRVVADKGADVFVAACERALPRLSGWSAVMIGADRFGTESPETPFLASLRPAAKAAGVECRGYARRGAVLTAMAEAAITVVPSRWEEPFGMVALEAMACGSALIATRQGGLAEVAGEAALFVPPDDAEALADAMVQLASDPGERGRRSQLGRARARGFEAVAARARLAALRAPASKIGG